MSNIDTTPFDTSIEVNRHHMAFSCPAMLDSLIQVNDTVDFAKKILLQNRVRDFSATDVLTLTKLILEREKSIKEERKLSGDEE